MTGLKSLIIRNISLRLVKCITPSYSTLNYRNQYVCCRQFHITNTCLAKAKRDKKIKEDIDNEVNEVGLPDIKNYEVMMDSRIFKLEEEFDKLRAGRPTADMLNHITVEADNSRIKITDAGQISMKNQNQIVISVFDPNNVQYVVAALKADTALNSNPATEGNNVVVSVPKPSKENRETLVKSVIRLSEKTKTEIRNIRKDGMDSIKKLKGSISEDDVRKLTKEVDGLTEKKLEKVSQLLKNKESKLLES